MNIRDIRIEPSRKMGEETEFFLQENRGGCVACSAHIHNAIELLYVREGSYRVIVDGVEQKIEQGDLILFCSNVIHHVFAGEAPVNRYYVIKIPPAFFLSLSRREMATEYIMRFALNRKESKNLWTREEIARGEMFPILQSLIQEYEGGRYAAEVAVKLKIMELLLAILRDGTQNCAGFGDRSVYLIYKAMEYVREHYAEDMNEAEIARSIGMSYSHFSRSFKRTTGMTFRKYLNLTRVNRAEELLYNNRESVSEVASRCGYNSTSYFISTYRALTGKTPYQVLKGVKGENG